MLPPTLVAVTQSAVALGDQTDLACWSLYGARGSARNIGQGGIGQGGLAPWAVVGGEGVWVSCCACWMSWPRRSMAFW